MALKQFYIKNSEGPAENSWVQQNENKFQKVWDVKFKLQKSSACQDLQKKFHSWKCPTTVWRVIPLEMHFFVDFHCFWLLK
jgi:hypothetical protein